MISGQEIWDLKEQVDLATHSLSVEMTDRLQFELEKILGDKILTEDEWILVANVVFDSFNSGFHLKFLIKNGNRRFERNRRIK